MRLHPNNEEELNSLELAKMEFNNLQNSIKRDLSSGKALARDLLVNKNPGRKLVLISLNRSRINSENCLNDGYYKTANKISLVQSSTYSDNMLKTTELEANQNLLSNLKICQSSRTLHKKNFALVHSKSKFAPSPKNLLIQDTEKQKWYDVRPRLMINTYYRRNFLISNKSRNETMLTLKDIWEMKKTNVDDIKLIKAF